MIQLYWAPHTRAIRPRWLLEEMEIPYQLERLDLSKGEHKTPEYLRIHPLGSVPALVDGDVTMFESAAICSYLADKHPEKRMAPPLGTPARALYEQWLFFGMATFEEPLVKIFLHSAKLPEADRSARAESEARKRAGEVAQVLEHAIRDRPFLLGPDFSAADVIVGSLLAWGNFMGVLTGFDRLQEYVGRLAERPALVRASADG